MCSKLFLAWLLVAFFTCGVTAQTHLSYVNPDGPFIDFTTDSSILNSNDTGGIIGYAERFVLPAGSYILDSVDFIMDSVGADSNAIDLVPVMMAQSNSGPEQLPDLSNPYAVTRLNSSAIIITPGTRTSISCGRISVANSFFIFIASNQGSNVYRASKRSTPVNLDTARAAFVAINKTVSLEPYSALIDGNLVPSDVNVDMDIGITYENSAGIQEHLTADGIATFPNPVQSGSSVNIIGMSAITSVNVLDATGRTVVSYHSNANGYITAIPTKGLSAGVYEAVLLCADGKSSNVKFVVK